MAGDAGPRRVYNVNVGVLGHVDSGKTSLVSALSQQLSTAALDKHPQSKERGITLDLGFSSFTVPAPPEVDADDLQFTLVDCPGHASLIRTVIGGAQIIDMMVLVVDITKGIQTQTAECLVLAEVCTRSLVVVLNKVDSLPEATRGKLVIKAAKTISKTLAVTRFRGAPMVPVSARPGGGEGDAKAPAQGVDALVAELLKRVAGTGGRRDPAAPFQFALDHCFAVKGKGTVMTGTVLAGTVKLEQTVELPEAKIQKKVKSIQVFRKPVPAASAGDRAAILVAGLPPDGIERGLLCAPGTLPRYSGAIVAAEKIRFYNSNINAKSKMHVSVGHSTVMATLQPLGVPDLRLNTPTNAAALGLTLVPDTPPAFDWEASYLAQDVLYGLEGRPLDASPGLMADQLEQIQEQGIRHYGPQWVVLRFEQPIVAAHDAMIIGSKLDADTAAGSTCRMAFHGRVVAVAEEEDLTKLSAFKWKMKQGTVERVNDGGQTAIVRNLVKPETDLTPFFGAKVVLASGIAGVITSAFGKTGKLKVTFEMPIPETAKNEPIALTFKKYIYGGKRRAILQ